MNWLNNLMGCTSDEKLGASNRIIGVISHVESMKSRIPARLEVRSTPEGPSILKMVGV